MLIEHAFITTSDDATAMTSAREALLALGFTERMGSAGRGLNCGRGKSRAERAVRIQDAPQSVRIEFDRGRVTVAALMEEPRQHRKHRDLVERCLFALAVLLEAVVARGQPLTEARVEWDRIHTEMIEHDRRRRRRQVIAVVLLIASVFGLFAIIAVVSLE